ncbi:protein kinase subdomain-containing protein [Thecamonas trahens ATCC 50062]|uniref:Protein kinase subdomain-containing protein n=1 Tax=Thecamonas trahens ATCC 50062 TaxID=461836 RepID=A0A0L0D4L4_THETB|nr:protein kinase subdomain-containing protein [Thecamonas trahens ATCC 50062]KNC47036.1 protein kinase subdomain-containing protein [Thecamonas trahens ATCC 50062]|eukprot:XP_013759816.1 protein kinase subdomain-containing protein [Thecamonas trahens ATCC 50062]
MAETYAAHDGQWGCNLCRRYFVGGEAYHCFHGCNFDACEECMARGGRRMGGPVEAPGPRATSRVRPLLARADVAMQDLHLGRLLGHSQYKDIFVGDRDGVPLAVTRTKGGVLLGVDPETMAALGAHPYLLSYHGHAQDSDGSEYIAFELCPDGPLETFLVREGSEWSLDLKIVLVRQIAAALAALHAAGVVHGHLSSRNVFVDSLAEPVVKVGDYGLTQPATHLPLPASISARAKLAHVFDAPEVLAGGAPSPASDVWQLGVVLWEVMANGARPYSGVAGVNELDPASVAAYLACGGRLPPPHACYAPLYKFMLACWSADPAARPVSTSLEERLAVLADAYYADPNYVDDNELSDDPAIDLAAPPPQTPQ